MADTPWQDIPLDARLYQNVDEAQLSRAYAALENCYVNDAGGISRFPGLTLFKQLPDTEGRVYLHDWHGDLIGATSDGRVFALDQDGNATDRTGVQLSGGKRVVFAKTEDELCMAAGGPILRLANRRTEVLSDDAPNATHIGVIDGYLVAAEVGSGRFMHSGAGAYRQWDPLDVFTADSEPDDVNALVITPYREIMLFGPESSEQWERLSTGDTPFFRRWGIGESLFGPYLMVHGDNALFLVNGRKEVVRVSGQSSAPASMEIGRVLQRIPDEDWSEAWIGGFSREPLSIDGQTFVVVQIPGAVSPYGTRGLTYLHDIARKRWFTLYGWDDNEGCPTRWPGWSHWPLWGRVFVGGDEGKIYEFDVASFAHAGDVQRMLVRTAHFGSAENELTNLRLSIKRGLGTTSAQSTIELRCKRDNRPWSRWVKKGLGKAGDRFPVIEFGGFGAANSFQFEMKVTDNVAIEILKLQGQFQSAGL